MDDVVILFDISFSAASTENELLRLFIVFVKYGLLIGSLVAIKFVIVVTKLDHYLMQLLTHLKYLKLLVLMIPNWLLMLQLLLLVLLILVY